MTYEKPTRSAGLIVSGLCAVLAGELVKALALIGVGNDGWQMIGGILQIGGVFCIVLGLGVLLSAVDAALLHRWKTTQDSAARAADLRGQKDVPQN